jgi:hypothetical protein
MNTLALTNPVVENLEDVWNLHRVDSHAQDAKTWNGYFA